ncbi:MAG TPA: MOSC domain-containing protein, partial [Desulfosporosinus sp.]
LGECVMPKEGIFIRLLEGGVVRSGDSIEVMA